MKNFIIPLLLVASIHSSSPDSIFSNRWYRFSHTYNNSYWAQTSQGLFTAESLAEYAAEHGFNGVQVPIQAALLKWNSTTINNFKHFVTHCSTKGIEVIPDMFPINSGGLVWDSNFAEAELIDNMMLICRNNSLHPFPDSTNKLRNGSLDTFSQNTFTGFGSDKPGISTFVDTVISFSGKSSIRMENFSANNGMVRIYTKIFLRSNNHYKLSFMLKKEDCAAFVDAKILGRFSNEIQRYRIASVPHSNMWEKHELEFTTGHQDSVSVFIGVWNAGLAAGKIWIDDLELKEAGTLSNIVRRADCPFIISSIDGKTTYREGLDYDTVYNKIRLDSIPLRGTAIADNQVVKISCYRVSFYYGTKTICMSHEPYYAFADSQAQFLYSIFKFKKIFLYIDEIRSAGSCGTCRASGLSTAQILGNCVTKLNNIVKRLNPAIKVYTWADMLDDNWNAKPNYYKVWGDFSGSVNHIPADITIVPWGDCMVSGSSTTPAFLGNSLDFFSSRGFDIMGCGYYDTGNLIGTANWIELLRTRSRARGLIYSSWGVQDYSQLGGFGDLMLEAINTTIENNKISLNTKPEVVVSPNPFNPKTTIQICNFINNPEIIPEISIFNNSGSLIIKSKMQPSDKYSFYFIWNGVDYKNRHSASGIYFIRLKLNNNISISKPVLLMR